MRTNDFKLFVPFSKSDPTERTVFGKITGEQWDDTDDIITFDAGVKAFDEFKKWRNVREMHQPSAVGTMPLIEMDEINKEISGQAHVVDDGAWQKVQSGVYKGFSLGGKIKSYRLETNPKTGRVGRKITDYILNEVSLVDRPALPSAVFSVIKTEGAEEIKEQPDTLRKIIGSWDKWAVTYKDSLVKISAVPGIKNPEAVASYLQKQAVGAYPRISEKMEIVTDVLESDLKTFAGTPLEQLLKEVDPVLPVAEDLERSEEDKCEFGKERAEHPTLTEEVIWQMVDDHKKEEAAEEETAEEIVDNGEVVNLEKGGAGSGNFGHEGRAGEVGGSGEGGGESKDTKTKSGYSSPYNAETGSRIIGKKVGITPKVVEEWQAKHGVTFEAASKTDIGELASAIANDRPPKGESKTGSKYAKDSDGKQLQVGDSVSVNGKSGKIISFGKTGEFLVVDHGKGDIAYQHRSSDVTKEGSRTVINYEGKPNEGKYTINGKTAGESAKVKKSLPIQESDLPLIKFSSVMEAVDVLTLTAKNPEEYYIESDADSPEQEVPATIIRI